MRLPLYLLHFSFSLSVVFYYISLSFLLAPALFFSIFITLPLLSLLNFFQPLPLSFLFITFFSVMVVLSASGPGVSSISGFPVCFTHSYSIEQYITQESARLDVRRFVLLRCRSI